MKQSRALSHDEKKAAEAAYQGKAFQSSWSKSARAVYDGILKARGISIDSVDHVETGVASIETPVGVEGLFEEALSFGTIAEESTLLQEPKPQEPSRHITSRQEAIDAGLLIDVSKKAQGVGFNLAVGITKSLWSRSISESSDTLDDAEAATSEGETRIRDMLLAVRLRLASLDTPSPWVEVPVLLPSHQGEHASKIFPIYALFHKDPVAEDCLTLIHPKELPSTGPSSHTSTEEEPSSSDIV